MMYTIPKNLLSICVNFTLATQQSAAEAQKKLRLSIWCVIMSTVTGADGRVPSGMRKVRAAQGKDNG